MEGSAGRSSPARETKRSYEDTMHALKEEYRAQYKADCEPYLHIKSRIEDMVRSPDVSKSLQERLDELADLHEQEAATLERLYLAVVADHQNYQVNEIHDFIETVFDVTATELASCLNKLIYNDQVALTSSREITVIKTEV